MVKKIFVQQYSKRVTHLSQQGYGKKKVQRRKNTTRKNTKKTSIGRRPKMSSMNKSRKRSWKSYNRQGK